MRTLILHEQVYKYVLSVKQHVQIIHNTKVKISIIVLVQFSDIYFCTENISGEKERGVNFWNFGFLNASVNLQMFSANQVMITIRHFFFYYKFSYTFKIWIFKYSVFLSYPFVCVCFHLEILKARFFFHFLCISTFLIERVK